ncbi:hypothetical protein AJ80_03974 [Polytolypa hystricis UAMH7299]|uniref:Uncharacterized protein n=1 Tax=Polytolypa hystricis (strain UAMH7299) TaxID=1447883 RepID=A0A2B7Y5A0_POLH7|nr:hypothetical protein AJ80_03974 [Polytolypa hystricis UAMH7299]
MYWLRIFEIWLTARLLASPSFHRAVHRVHKSVQELRHGKAPEDMGGTNVEKPGVKHFLKHFRDELKDQFQRKPPKK